MGFQPMQAHVAFEEYMVFMKKNPDTGFNARIALAFYCHLAEASGFYEIPKNMLCVRFNFRVSSVFHPWLN